MHGVALKKQRTNESMSAYARAAADSLGPLLQNIWLAGRSPP